MSGGVFAFCGTVGVFLNVQFFFFKLMLATYT